MATSYSTLTIPSAAWTDLIALNATLASKALTVQNTGGFSLRVFFGGASAPGAAADGQVLAPGQAFTGTAAHIWVYAPLGGQIACTEND